MPPTKFRVQAPCSPEAFIAEATEVMPPGTAVLYGTGYTAVEMEFDPATYLMHHLKDRGLDPVFTAARPHDEDEDDDVVTLDHIVVALRNIPSGGVVHSIGDGKWTRTEVPYGPMSWSNQRLQSFASTTTIATRIEGGIAYRPRPE